MQVLTLGAPVSGDTSNAQNDYHGNGVSCTGSGGTDGPDVVYQFTPASSGTFTFTLTPTSLWDAVLYIAPLSGCTATSVGSCLAKANQNGIGGDESLTLALTSGVTYVVVVDGKAATDKGTYTLSATEQIDGADACQNVPDLPIANPGDSITFTDDLSRSGLNNDASSNPNTCNSGTQSPDVVYHFNPAVDVSVQIDVSYDALSGFTPSIYLRAVCDDTNSEIRCADPGVSGFNSPLTLTIGDLPPTAGGYYLWIDGYQGSAGPFTATVTFSAVPAPQLGDNCSSINLNGHTSQITLTSQGAGQLAGSTQVDLTNYNDDSQSLLSGSCAGAGYGPDQVFSVNLPSGVSNLTASIDPGFANAVIYIRESPCADVATGVGSDPSNELVCSQGFGTQTVQTGILASGTYYIWVDSTQGNPYTGTLTVTSP